MNFSNPFTFKGLISRSHFAVSYLGLVVAPPVLFSLIFSIIRSTGIEAGSIVIQILLLVASVAAFIYLLSITVRRARDIGYSAGEIILGLFIPIVNLYLIFRLFFSPADARDESMDNTNSTKYTSLRELKRQAKNQSESNEMDSDH